MWSCTNDVHFMWTTIACKLQCKLQGMNKQWSFLFFQNSQTHTLVASSSCTTKTCYTKNHHHNGLLHLHNLCIHKAFEKHTLLEFAHHLHMLFVPFFQRMGYNKFMFHSAKLVPWHVLCQPYLSCTLENISRPLKHTHFVTLPFHLITQNLKHLGL